MQLLELYGPVLKCRFPPSLWKFQYLEVVRWFDPDVKVADGLRKIAEPFAQTFEKGVHIWK